MPAEFMIDVGEKRPHSAVEGWLDGAGAGHHHRMVDVDDRPRPSPVELIEGALERVEQRRDAPPEPPGNEWNFALGVLFALGATGQLDEQQVRHYETRIQAEARRLRDPDQVS